MKYHLTRISSNAKTGPIPVVTISKESCPTSCPLQGNGCYAETSHQGIHWKKVTDGERGVEFDQLIDQLEGLPHYGLWRYAVAGDLPGKGNRIRRKDTMRLAEANRFILGKGFTYTHKQPHLWDNAAIIKDANEAGFTINLSSNSLSHADKLLKLQIGPVVTLLPSDMGVPFEYVDKLTLKTKVARKWDSTRTPEGNVVVQCPAEYNPQIKCHNCGYGGEAYCQRSDRKFIVGFTNHGVAKKKADAVTRLPVFN